MVERWKKLVFLSPSKVQSVLDFKAENSSSKRRVWWYSLRSFFPRQKESGQNHYTELFEYHLDGQAVFFFFVVEDVAKVYSMYARVPSQSVRSRIVIEIGLLTSSPWSFLESCPTPFMPLPSLSNLTLLTSQPRTYRRMASSTPTQLTPYPRTP